MKVRKIFLALYFILLFFTKAFSFDLSSVNSSLSDAFSSFIDKNEGLTSFRSLNIPSGGRAESMGTAFAAVSDDASFFDYNPASSSTLKNTEAAVFHNAWIADSAMETVAWTSRSGNLGYGAQLKCFYVPFTEYNLYGDRVAGSYYSETSLTLNGSYNFLSGYNFKGIAVGWNFRTSWRNVPDYTNNQTDAIIKGSGLAQSSLGLMGDVGALVRFDFLKHFDSRDPNLSFALVLSNAGQAFTGWGEEIKKDDPLPTRISGGIAWRMFKPLLISAEFRQPLNFEDFSSNGKWSAGGGIELSITKFFALDGGFLIQGGNPRISFGGQCELKKIRLNACYTLDLTTSANPVNRISLSATFRFGDKGRGKRQAEIDAYYAKGLEYYAMGDRENIEKAIDVWEKAYELDKTFDPVSEALAAARGLLAAHDAINEYGTLK